MNKISSYDRSGLHIYTVLPRGSKLGVVVTYSTCTSDGTLLTVKLHKVLVLAGPELVLVGGAVVVGVVCWQGLAQRQLGP